MKTVLRQWQKTLQNGLDLLFPPRCAGCNRSGNILCPRCLAAIISLPALCCARCGTPLAANGTCAHCAYRPSRLTGLRTVSLYQEPLRTCIHALKYHGNTRLAGPLGTLLARTYAAHGLRADLLVPVPLHVERQRLRGYNHAQLLAEECASQLGVPLRAELLTRIRATPAQARLTTRERQRNVEGAFSVSSHAASILRERRIVIVDDVSTTGATLEACATPLFAAGAKEAWGLVLARSI